jgi:hypothetical protein
MLASKPAAPSSTGNAAYRRWIRGTRQGDIIRAAHITKYMGRIMASFCPSRCNARDKINNLIRRAFVTMSFSGGTLRMRTLASIVLVVFSLVAVIPPVHAQTSHAAPQSALDAAIKDHTAAAEADRETVRRLLARPEVQAIAGDLGLDLRRAESAVATLDAEQLTELAAQARQAEEGLAGGQSRIVISTTVIIIALLVLILIIVAVD